MRLCGGVVLWLHENYIGFFSSYIKETGPWNEAGMGVVPCPIPPVGWGHTR
jgi:hypothetical protein